MHLDRKKKNEQGKIVWHMQAILVLRVLAAAGTFLSCGYALNKINKQSEFQMKMVYGYLQKGEDIQIRGFPGEVVYLLFPNKMKLTLKKT